MSFLTLRHFFGDMTLSFCGVAFSLGVLTLDLCHFSAVFGVLVLLCGIHGGVPPPSLIPHPLYRGESKPL